MSEIVEILLSPFGGVTVTLVALSSFLGHIFSKRIIPSCFGDAILNSSPAAS